MVKRVTGSTSKGRASIKRDTVRRVEREGRELRKAAGKAGRAADTFQNFSLALGQGTNNALAGSTYGFHPITRIRTLLDWIHRGSWIGGMAIDLPADDMTRAGIELLSVNAPEDEEKLLKALVRLNVWESIKSTIKWARLYGGCLGVFMIDGQDPSTPLRLDTVGKKQFRGVYPMDRWMVDPNLQNLVREMGPDVGLPVYYRVVGDAPIMRNQVIHYSRCMRLEGLELPYWQKVMENLWGLSVLERLYDRMIAFDSATTGAAQLVYKSYIRTYAIDGLREASAAGGDALQTITQFVEMMRKFQGIEGITLIDTKDKFEAHQTTAFTGIGEALLQFGQQLSGALQIPLVRLFGQSPAGLNSTGESDLRTYYDGINQQQEKYLRSGMEKIIRLTGRSEGVELPDAFDFNFRPLWQLNEDEKSQISDRDTRIVIETEGSGLISAQTALQELKQRSKITGRWTNITPQMVDEADTTTGPPDPEVETTLGAGEGEHPIKAGEKLGEIEREKENEDYESPFAALLTPPDRDDDDDDPGPIGGGFRSKDRARRRRRTNDDAVAQIMRAALSDPHVQAAMREPDIDRSHDVVSGAVASAEQWRTYVSSMLPHRAEIDGKAIDPGWLLNVHEMVERWCMMTTHLPYAQAHIIATRAEKIACETIVKVKWKSWEAWIDGELSRIEHGPRDNPPPNPHVDPVQAIGHHRRKAHASDAGWEIVHCSSGGPGQMPICGNKRYHVSTPRKEFETNKEIGAFVKCERCAQKLQQGQAKDANPPYSTIGDLQVVIEYARGTIRRFEDGEVVVPADYGYIRRVGSVEGDQEWLDCFVGPNHGSRQVWVIDATKSNGRFDEHKVMLGFDTARDALTAFRNMYNSHRGIGAVTHLSLDSYAFKTWLASGDKNLPLQHLKKVA